ncbi:hypothetical protein TNCT_725511 [Trichonephila clavata]|uniref:Secreted protein n=1 Tax=Trichonephila clavata TaxID=2740835 RepID=A0A8X6EZ94_TRICU|nr:hypothetical protein TNCT_725511 [Trichonephila clavata]
MNVFMLHLCMFISINAICKAIAARQGEKLDHAPIDPNINVDFPFQEEALPREQENADYWKQEVQRLLEHWPSNSDCESKWDF